MLQQNPREFATNLFIVDHAQRLQRGVFYNGACEFTSAVLADASVAQVQIDYSVINPEHVRQMCGAIVPKSVISKI